jgi:hypothetical protein
MSNKINTEVEEMDVPWLDAPPDLDGAFETNIRTLLAACGRAVDLPGAPGVSVHVIELVQQRSRAITRLHVYREPVSEGASVCDQCRCMGAAHLSARRLIAECWICMHDTCM